MQLVIEFNVPNTLKIEGVKGIFYEGPIICINYKNRLITFEVLKDNQTDTLERFDNFVRNTIPEATKSAVKLCIAANWKLVLTCRTQVPTEVLERESLELNQQEYLDRLDSLSGFNPNPNPIPSSLLRQKTKSNVFSTYVVIKVVRQVTEWM